MPITINVRLSSGAYQARAMGLGVTASCAESALAAARAVCRKLSVDPELLIGHGQDDKGVQVFTHPDEKPSP
ncbi:hypothetical protein [Pseudomonas syringae]|nr:hypothetical protein [Pseudomonas syringae]